MCWPNDCDLNDIKEIVYYGNYAHFNSLTSKFTIV